MKKVFLSALLILFSMSEIANGETKKPVQSPDQYEEEEIGKMEMLIEEAFSHLGTRYRSGAKGPSAFDCSGFTSYVYKQQTGIFVGASSRDQYARNTPIRRDEIQCGDLVFFTSPHSGRNVGHVGIVVDVDPVTLEFTFIHASSTSGVKLSSSSDSNYAKRYVGARRILELSAL